MKWESIISHYNMTRVKVIIFIYCYNVIKIQPMLISVEPLYNFVRKIYTVFYIPLLAPVYRYFPRSHPLRQNPYWQKFGNTAEVHYSLNFRQGYHCISTIQNSQIQQLQSVKKEKGPRYHWKKHITLFRFLQEPLFCSSNRMGCPMDTLFLSISHRNNTKRVI